MAYTVTVKDCNSQSGISNATIGNGNCYSVSNGVYTFETCEDVAACAGGSSVGVSVDNASLPSTGGQATFTVSYYGKSSSFSATKSKTGTGGSSWSGNVSVPAHVCPTASTISLSASNNSTTSQVVYTVSAGGSSASVTQAASIPTVNRTITIKFPDIYNVEASGVLPAKEGETGTVDIVAVNGENPEWDGVMYEGNIYNGTQSDLTQTSGERTYQFVLHQTTQYSVVFNITAQFEQDGSWSDNQFGIIGGSIDSSGSSVASQLEVLVPSGSSNFSKEFNTLHPNGVWDFN